MLGNMSRFFKSAAFPILIVVVLAFFASKLVSSTNGQKVPTFGETLALINQGAVKSVNLDQKDDSMTVVTIENQKYTTGYPNNYVSTIIKDVQKHEPERRSGSSSRTPRRAAGSHC